jgi:hypothetical protein
MYRHAALTLGLIACSSSEDISTSESALACFHGSTQIACKTVSGTDAERTKVEDFYPSACFDGDADLDGIPDYLDLDFIDSDDADEPAERDDLRCPKCNRGPGTQNDFRLRIEGSAGELQRGKVYVRGAGELTIPTPDGVLTVSVTAGTRIDDGDPDPGAEIRVEGTVENGVLEATRLKVLCPAPPALPPEDMPPDAQPPRPDPSGPIIL